MATRSSAAVAPCAGSCAGSPRRLRSESCAFARSRSACRPACAGPCAASPRRFAREPCAFARESCPPSYHSHAYEAPELTPRPGLTVLIAPATHASDIWSAKHARGRPGRRSWPHITMRVICRVYRGSPRAATVLRASADRDEPRVVREAGGDHRAQPFAGRAVSVEIDEPAEQERASRRPARASRGTCRCRPGRGAGRCPTGPRRGLRSTRRGRPRTGRRRGAPPRRPGASRGRLGVAGVERRFRLEREGERVGGRLLGLRLLDREQRRGARSRALRHGRGDRPGEGRGGPSRTRSARASACSAALSPTAERRAVVSSSTWRRRPFDSACSSARRAMSQASAIRPAASWRSASASNASAAPSAG